VEQRVPAEEYEANLHQIVRLCHERGIRILLCTTPDGMTSRGIEFRFLKDRGSTNRFHDLYRLFQDKGESPEEVWHYIHRLYNEKVARVAQSGSVEIVDLEKELHERRQIYDGPALWLFKDGIHFTELGLQEVAQILALHVLQREERVLLAKYLDSPTYCRRNMDQFIAQWQFAAADYMLTQAESANGQPFADSDKLRAYFAAERTFYDPYYAGLFELSNGGDAKVAFTQLLACLQRRPDDINLRLSIARYALLAQTPQVTLDLIHAPGVEYTNPKDAYTATWLTTHAARTLGLTNVAREQLRLIHKEFPQDPGALEMLTELGG
jgi:hypothetical protein